MGPEAAINAVHFNRLEAIDDADLRAVETQRLRDEYMENLDIYRAASEFFVDAVVAPDALRGELARRLKHLGGQRHKDAASHHSVIRG